MKIKLFDDYEVRVSGHHIDSQYINVNDAFKMFKKHFSIDKKYHSVKFCTRYSFEQRSKLVYCTLNNTKHECLALNTEYIYYKYPTGSIELIQFENVGQSIEFWKMLTKGKNFKLYLDENMTEFPKYYIGSKVHIKKSFTYLDTLDQSNHKWWYYVDNKKTVSFTTTITKDDILTVSNVYPQLKSLTKFENGKWKEVATRHEGELVFNLSSEKLENIPMIEGKK